MTYQSERARNRVTEPGRVFEVSKVRLEQSAARQKVHAVSRVQLDADGRITGVLWGEVDTAQNDWAKPEVVAPVGQVVDALLAGEQVFALFPSLHGHVPERQFVVADCDGSRRTIVLAGPVAYEREVHDMDRLAAAG